MGARIYLASLGRFLQTDPVRGGTPNSYVYPTDPVNQEDLNGEWSLWGGIQKAAKWAWGQTKKAARWAWKNRGDIALTAAGFIPGLGVAAWVVRAVRVVRALNAGKNAIRATRATSWLAGKIHVGWRGVTKARASNGAKWFSKNNNHWRSSAKKYNGYGSNLERYQKGHHLHKNLHIQHNKPRWWAPWW